MEILRVPNNGEHLRQRHVVTFLTLKGYQTPKYVYVGISNGGIEIAKQTKKECQAAIERDNRLFPAEEG